MTTQVSPGMFVRLDEGDDGEFYAFPRLVTHVDDPTIAALTRYLDEVLPAEPAVLDLMSSWISHLPPRRFREVVCLGMNAEELGTNGQASESLVHDLNRTPELPYEDERFDFVLISFSVQYLIQPQAVFAAIARVLRPGGQFVVAMSHRCFPTKAIHAFQVLPPMDRVRLVGYFIGQAGRFHAPEFIDRSPIDADPLWLVSAQRE